MGSTYLGDGVLVKRECDDVVLETSDGATVTNRVVLGPDEFEGFLVWGRLALDPDVFSRLIAYSEKVPSAAEEKMRATLRRLAHRCERQVKPAEKIERERVVAWLKAQGEAPCASAEGHEGDLALGIERGAHLPGGKLPPEEPLEKRMLTCKAAGLPSSMRCASCQSYHALGLDADSGEPLAPAPAPPDTPHRSG
jgi:hypothetical protein